MAQWTQVPHVPGTVTEHWHRRESGGATREIQFDVRPDGTVIVAAPVLREMLGDISYLPGPALCADCSHERALHESHLSPGQSCQCAMCDGWR